MIEELNKVVSHQEKITDSSGNVFADLGLAHDEQQEVDLFMGPIGPGPLSQRLKVMNTVTRLRVSAELVHAGEVEKLIKILEANKALLEDDAKDVSSAPTDPTSDKSAS